MSHLHDGKKAAWEELRWDQDIQRWIGPRRDDHPEHRVQRLDDAHRGEHGNPLDPGLLD